MRRVWKVVGDVATVTGCVVGIGFLSGKEAQLFWSSGANIALFAVAFAIITFVVRSQCAISHSDSTEQLMRALFGKGGVAMNYAVVLCSFVCAVTTLAGVQQALSMLIFPTPLPVFAFVAAVLASVLCRASTRLLKIANAVAVALSLVLIALLYTLRGGSPQSVTAPPYMPIAYALVGVTVSLGVNARLAVKCSRGENLAVAVGSALLTALLMGLVLPLCRFEYALPTLYGLPAGARAFAAVTLLFASVTGLAANALPVCETLYDVIPDGTLCSVTVFGAALALSMFGFDFALRFGYGAIAICGIGIAVKCIKKGSDPSSNLRDISIQNQPSKARNK